MVGGYLGTISHTLTALDVLAQRQLTIAAIVVSESERNPVELDDTVASIARFAHGVDVVGLPRLPGGINQHPAFARIAAHLYALHQPLQIDEGFEHAFGIDQRVQQHGQDASSRWPSAASRAAGRR